MSSRFPTVLMFVTFWLSCDEKDPDMCVPYRPPVELDVYEYPLVPGMNEWSQLQTGAEMYDATQLPDTILNTISTEGLVETCYNYPLQLNIIAWPTTQQGVESIMKIFNGYQELASRPDGAWSMCERVKMLQPACVLKMTNDLESASETLSNALFINVLSQDVFLSKLTSIEQKNLLRDILEDYTIMKRHMEIFGNFSVKANAILMARIMLQANYAPFVSQVKKDEQLQLSIEDIEIYRREQILNTIELHAFTFIFQ